eukprot:CAMPEP_0180134816 /NCGR_PEP_ID=MMETSP0986-20121125/10404_1 /TAXON_ID=697907 /ORGANISM="non described non described, Strain CCMP2293" /LENGTH=53 /DNA_ID=CAMNT_0022075283 /DNA_START=857 /DNA_END=1014 /DNA_ORIENTATION=+
MGQSVVGGAGWACVRQQGMRSTPACKQRGGECVLGVQGRGGITWCVGPPMSRS